MNIYFIEYIHFFDKLEYLDEVTKDKHVFTILTTNGYMLKHEAFLEKVAASSIDIAFLSLAKKIHAEKAVTLIEEITFQY